MRVLLVLLILTAIASGAPKAVPSTPKPKITLQQALDAQNGLMAINVNLKKEVEDTKAELASERTAHTSAMTQAVLAQGEVVKVKTDLKNMEDWGNEQQARAQVAEAKVAKYNRLVLIIAIAAASFAALYCFELFKPAGFIGNFFPLAKWLQWAGPLFVWVLVFGAVQVAIRTML